MAVEATGATWPAVLRTKELQEKIKSAKVLCVGAGGIGCELLKTLVCTGFRNIEVIDLDTIETSNLNRQFLFRKHHVGQSKANTAAQVVKGFCPAASITAHHANIKEGRFDVDFLRGFDIVLNGLDNLEARRHVNRLCLAAERPLVESGTAGYLGQVTVHLKGRTECFECQPKPTPKSFPICTLRNTPDRPIHTIVWAKDLLFNRLFGPPEAVSDLDDQARREEQQQQAEAEAAAATEGGDEASGDAAADAAAAAAATAAANAATAEDPSFFLRRDGEASLDYAGRVFERVYTTDIESLCGVKELWEKRPPPKPLRLTELLPDPDMAAIRSALEGAKAKGPGGQAACSASRALGLANASQKWTAAQNASVLLLAVAMYHELRKEEVGSASFDKDDDLAVDFVTAASNLRSFCYGIPEQSLFDAKGMAGNIIHAIATTNAIISGLIVTEALKILAGCLEAVRNTYLYEFPTSKRQLVVQRPDPPCKNCMVCGKAQLTLRISTEVATLASLLSGVIKKRLAVSTPNLVCGGFMYEEGEGLDEDEVAAYAALLPRTLSALPGGGLRHGSVLTVQDQSQHFGVDIIIAHSDDLKAEDAPEGFLLEGDVPAAQQQPQEPTAAAPAGAAAAAAAAKRNANEFKEEDGVLVLDDDDEEAGAKPAAAVQAPSRKRALEDGEDRDGTDAKRAKGVEAVSAAAAEDDDDVVIIDDD
ncbi:hypothetical protein PLESTB_000169600 [Pleodorina starrii]|uniref:SUMO-activating enzyme subunit n=1 Tax=Pleodorina starrii TaxID=330485 RepID=A0A9W6BCF1_9CHLO|nr:hypothetical protein PLESTM_000398200 [Pleodorina starrii]GLC48981.1 hypothetical protein PLESTB_000169600 [Pleodorina starrii]GLC70432.1 hypothetical protein PLESTF_000973000 [Pleodorina starrii]